MNLLLNLLFAVLAFFGTQYVLSVLLPAGDNRDKILVVVALIVAIVVFMADFAARALA